MADMDIIKRKEKPDYTRVYAAVVFLLMLYLIREWLFQRFPTQRPFFVRY